MFIENIHNSWHTLSRNKVRSFLTMLGVIIGVMAIIIIMSVGAGAQSLILDQIKSMGSNLLGVLPGKSEDKGPPASVFGIVITTLTLDDAKALAKYAPPITAVAGYVKGTDTVTAGDNQTDTSFVGTSASYINVEDTKVAKGRFFSGEEEQILAKVVVLGSQTAADLFGDEDPIGKRIRIRKINFNVIGVMRPRGTSGFQNQDDQILVPITTAQKMLLGINYLSFMRIKVASATAVPQAMEIVSAVLRERHHITNPENDDFSVRSANQGLDVLINVTNALRFFLAAIVAISLIVGGIGIMNIMLATVQERTREIGLRKAIGAKKRQIVQQFLVETSLITFVAGVIGIILGILISMLVSVVARGLGYNWDLVISLSSIFIGCAISIGIGLLFGLLPAKRASELDPIEALRYE